MKNEIIIKWRCTNPKRIGEGRFNKNIFYSNDAAYNKYFGWICDCGRWTTGDDAFHKPLKMGIREIVDCRKLRRNVDIPSIIQIIPKKNRNAS